MRLFGRPLDSMFVMLMDLIYWKCVLNLKLLLNSFNSLFIGFLLTGCALKQPPHMVVEKEKRETLTCSQLQTSYIYKYWYKQERENTTQLQLLVYSTSEESKEVEHEFKNHFSFRREKNEAIYLQLNSAQLEDSGTYFCAESSHSRTTAEGTRQKPLHRKMQVYHTTDPTQLQPKMFCQQR